MTERPNVLFVCADQWRADCISALGHPMQSLVANLVPSLTFLALLPWLLSHYGLAGAGYQALGQAIVAGCALMAIVWYDTRKA